MTNKQLNLLKRKYLREGYKKALNEISKYRFENSDDTKWDSFYHKALGNMIDLLTEAILEDSPWSDNEKQYRLYKGKALDSAEKVGFIINNLEHNEYEEFLKYCKSVLFQEGASVVRDAISHILDVYADHAAGIQKGYH